MYSRPEASDGVKIRLPETLMAHHNGQLHLKSYVLEVDQAKYCPSDGALSLVAPKMAGPLGQLSARRVQGQYQNEESMALQFESAWFSACTCDDPPWRVRFEEAQSDGACLRATWPTWTSAVADCYPPRLSFDWTRPYSGPLVPRFSWRTVTGWRTDFPVRWSFNRHHALTLSLGQEGNQSSGTGRLDWQTTELDQNYILMKAQGDTLIYDTLV